jgi:hypothetical protein
MVTPTVDKLRVEADRLGTFELDGEELPFVDLNDAPFVHTCLVVGATEYRFHRSYPVRGHAAVMPDDVAELRAAGKQLLVAERGDRYYLYVA